MLRTIQTSQEWINGEYSTDEQEAVEDLHSFLVAFKDRVGMPVPVKAPNPDEIA